MALAGIKAQAQSTRSKLAKMVSSWSELGCHTSEAPISRATNPARPTERSWFPNPPIPSQVTNRVGASGRGNFGGMDDLSVAKAFKFIAKPALRVSNINGVRGATPPNVSTKSDPATAAAANASRTPAGVHLHGAGGGVCVWGGAGGCMAPVSYSVRMLEAITASQRRGKMDAFGGVLRHAVQGQQCRAAGWAAGGRRQR